MRTVKATAAIEAVAENALLVIEAAGRTCYQSEARGEPAEFVRMLIRRGHESVLEHASMTVRFVVNRGVSHELVRHRLASFSQESTRYCNYGAGRFGRELTFVQPCYWPASTDEYQVWTAAMAHIQDAYLALLDGGASPQEARAVLPNSLKTEVVMTANLREWRHVFKLRTSPQAHPQMREVMRPLAVLAYAHVPAVFDDLFEGAGIDRGARLGCWGSEEAWR